MFPHAHVLRTGRIAIPGQVYTVTTVTRGRFPIFQDFCRARRLVAVLREHQHLQRANTLCFVIMPDHLHWLLQLGDHHDLGTVVRSMKALSSHRIGLPLWQKGFFDRALRCEDDAVKAARYMVGNPLRAGLVDHIGDYPHWDAMWL